MPEVSIVMPAYNAAAFIGWAIDSVLAQTHSGWELIVVNDGSTDDTEAVVRSYGEARIRCLRQANQGPGAARNLGLANSQGDCVIFLDADDWWDARCLAALVEGLSKTDPQDAVVHADWAYAGDAERPGDAVSSALDANGALATLVLRNPIAIHCALVRRAALLAVGGFPTEDPALEDWELWLRLAAAGYGFVHVPELLAFYTWRPGSKGKDVESRKADRLATLDRLWARLDLPAAIRELRGRSYATAHVDFCVSQLGLGQTEPALQELDAAVGHELATATAVDTFYRIAFADDPLGATLNTTAAEERITAVLAHLAGLSPQVDLHACQHAADYALGMAGYRQGDMIFARRHLAQALRWKPGALLNPNFSRFAVRAFLPRYAIAAYRRIKKPDTERR